LFSNLFNISFYYQKGFTLDVNEFLVFLPWVIGKTPRLIFLIFSCRISAIVVTADELDVAEVVVEEEVPRLARVARLGHADCPSEIKQSWKTNEICSLIFLPISTFMN
jgi:hypothetical protein